jgi:hypothetical protein
MEQFGSAAELLRLVGHVNQLVAALRFGSLSENNETAHRAELNRLREVLALVDNRAV